MMTPHLPPQLSRGPSTFARSGNDSPHPQQQEIKHNRDAFYQALPRRNVMKIDNLKNEKRQLLQQQAVWLSVARSLQSYKDLMLQKENLVERAVEAYGQSIDTEEYERLMGEIELKLSEQEYSLGSFLAGAKIDDRSMTDGRRLQHLARLPWGAVE